MNPNELMLGSFQTALSAADPLHIVFLLSLTIELDGLERVHALACDTDGIDASEDNAGVLLLPDAAARAARLGIEAKKLLAVNDGYSFFSALGDLVITGPTRTNVNDYRVILVR